MAHVRQQVREAAIAALTGLPITGPRVFAYRIYPLDHLTELPALCVRTPADSANPYSDEGVRDLYQRPILLEVYAYTSAVADMDDALDAIAVQVEAVLGRRLLIGATEVHPVYNDSVIEFIEGERPAGQLKITYTLTVFCRADQPDVLQ